jgi:molybdenum cofactor synthesis domain-containing protein
VTRAHVITVSDGVSAGTRVDASGAVVARLLTEARFEVSGPQVVPDTSELIGEAILAAVNGGAGVVVTTGGTGLGPRDVTPQASAALFDFEVPGIAETMRRAGAESTPLAALSRSTAGVRGRALIINLPGSPKGAAESLEAVIPILGHAMLMLQGETKHEKNEK